MYIFITFLERIYIFVRPISVLIAPLMCIVLQIFLPLWLRMTEYYKYIVCMHSNTRYIYFKISLATIKANLPLIFNHRSMHLVHILSKQGPHSLFIFSHFVPADAPADLHLSAYVCSSLREAACECSSGHVHGHAALHCSSPIQMTGPSVRCVPPASAAASRHIQISFRSRCLSRSCNSLAGRTDAQRVQAQALAAKSQTPKSAESCGLITVRGGRACKTHTPTCAGSRRNHNAQPTVNRREDNSHSQD